LSIKVGSVLCVIVMVTVVFQQMQSAGGPASVGGGYGTDSMEDWESSRPVTLSRGDSVAPSATAMGDGVVHLAWIDTRTGSGAIYYKRSADGGQTFTSDRRVSEIGSQPGKVSVSASADGGSVAIVWDAVVEVDNHTGRAVIFRESTDGGLSFGKSTFVTFGSTPQIQFHGDDMILTLLQDDWSRGATYLRTLRISTGTKAQDPADDLLSFDTSASSLRMVVEEGMAHVIWDEWMEGRHVILHSSVDLSSGRVEGAHLVAIPGGTLLPESMTMSASDRRIVLAWGETKDGVTGVLAASSSDMGAHWGSTVAITDMKSNAANPAVTTNSTGVLTVVWQDDLGGPWRLIGQSFRDLGIPISPAKKITYGNSDASKPVVAIDGQDTIYLFWQDRRGGRISLYMDSDLSLRRPLIGSVLVYAGRLPKSAFASPEQQSRMHFLGLLRDLRSSIAQSEEQMAAMKIRTFILPRMDGSLGGNALDDLLVDPKAQAHLAWSFRLMLRELDPDTSGSGRTRSEGSPVSGEEPLPPDTQFSYSNYAPVFNITVSNVTSTTAKVSWETDPPNAYSTWLNWGENTTMGNQVFAPQGNPWSVTLTWLEANTIYYYGVQAVLQTTPPPPMYVAYDSFYTGVLIGDMDYYVTSAENATVWWETNLPSTAFVRYNTTADYGLVAVGDNGTFHQANLTGLDPRWTYHFQLESVALSDQILWAQSSDFNLTTHLFIKNLTVASTGFADGSYYVKLTWNSSRNASSEVRYGNTTLYGQEVEGTSGRTHNVTLQNLSSATAYFYQAGSVGLENANDSDAVEGPPIATPPISIYNITVNATSSSAEVSWETNYNGTTVARCGATENYTYNQTGTNGTQHSVTFSNLGSATTYHFRVESASLTNANDTAIGLDRTFTTKDILVTNVQVTNLGANTATVIWSTGGDPGTTLLRYGRNSIWENDATGVNGTAHSVTLQGLLPETKYYYRAESSSLSNLNDTNVSLTSFFTTAYAPNDADSGADAGNTINLALPTEPGSYKGREEAVVDRNDFYRMRAGGNESIKALLAPPVNMDLDLFLYGPDQQLKASSQRRGLGLPESLSYTASSNGFWYLEVRLMSVQGGTSGYYTLTFNVTAGMPERLVLDVGASGDANLIDRIPGLSIDASTGWGNPAHSTASSTATFWNVANKPWYRNATTNSTFYLNLYRNSPEKYTDWLVTLQYYCSEDVNVSLYNGAGWVNVTTLPGKGNWWTQSLVLVHTLFYDYLPSTIGINVAMRFSDLVQVDNISAIAYGYSTYVGHGSDDNDTLYHSPGILTSTGWTDTGNGYRDGTNCSELILNIPDSLATYNVKFRFKGDVEELGIEQRYNNGWVRLATLVSFGMDDFFNTNQSAYEDAYPSAPGLQVRIRFVATAINEFTYASMRIVRWFDEVGASGDNYLWLHEPGMSLYPNGQWGQTVVLDGREVKYGQRDSEVYLSAPLIGSDYVVYLTYKATSGGGQVKQWNGGTWEVLGDLLGDGYWHTGVYRTNSSIYRDYYGSEQLNVLLHFTMALYLDRMWAEPDQDGDHMTDYGETQTYPEDELPNGTLPLAFDIPVYTSGVYRFSGSSRGDWNQQLDSQRAEQGFYVNNTLVSVLAVGVSKNRRIGHLEEDVEVKLNRTIPPEWRKDFAFNIGLCSGPKSIKVVASYRPSEILSWRYSKVSSWTESNDTDGDGLSDYQEACVLHTRLDDPDTDQDGLTDYDEVYSFSYVNSSSQGYLANVTTNITVDAFARYAFQVRTSAIAIGGAVSAQVYLDGQLRDDRNTSDGWNNQTTAFVASMAKGLHSLEVKRGSGTGKVWVFEVEVGRTEATSPLWSDRDRDGLSDGDEVKGATGWYTSPAIADTDGDVLTDGDELRAKRTDPMKNDTDMDGFPDSVDLDPLHDLIVQVWMKQLLISDECPQGQTGCLWYGEVGVNGNYTRGDATALMDSEGRGNHYISVNVPDDSELATVVIKAFRNGDPPVSLDLTPETGNSPLILNFALLDNVHWGVSTGDEEHHARVYYEIRTVRFAKTNTILMTPTDWSTVLNGSTGLHRFVGEQRFAVLNLNVVDAGGMEAYWNMERTEDYLSQTYFTDLTGHYHRARRGSPGTMDLTQGIWGKGLHMVPGIGNEYPWVADDNMLDFSGEMTVSFWVKPHVNYDSNSNEGRWYWSVGKWEAWTLGWFGGEGLHGLKFVVRDGNNGEHSVQSDAPLGQGNWHHIVGTYDGMNMTIYLDGERLVSQINGGFTIQSTEHIVLIGRASVDGDNLCGFIFGNCYDFDGVMDEVALYGRALKDTEIALFNNRVVDLDMDTMANSYDSQQLKDLSGHGNNAVLDSGFKAVQGERGLALQFLEGSHAWIDGRGTDVDSLTMAVRLYWKGGTGLQTIALGKDSWQFAWGVVTYSLGVVDSQGTLGYGLGRQGETFINTTATGAKLPPNQWHVVTLTYDGLHSRLYLDGEKVHEKTWGSTKGLAHPPDPDMFIGRCPGGVQFNGYMDDLTLWNHSLGQGEIRALNYLDRGLNGIVVPRGLFFQSQFFSNLNTTSFSGSSPIVGSTVMGNDNPGELNARTIQQLIAANLTLAAAWTWIQELMTANDTGNVTSFPLVVTGEIYTIGLDRMVLNVLANMTVQNSGNSSEPPPPIREPTFWEGVWNSFTGLLSAAWNAVVAVATFVANVALAVIKWCIDFAVAIANGEGLEFFYETVVKPFVEAILAFIRWVIDAALSILAAIFNPVIQAARAWTQGVMDALIATFTPHSTPLAAMLPLEGLTYVYNAMTSGSFWILLFMLWMAFNIVRYFLVPFEPLLLPFGPFLAEQLFKIVLTVALTILVDVAIGAAVLYLVRQSDDPFWTEGVGLCVISIVNTIGLFIATRLAGQRLTWEFIGFGFAILGIFLQVFLGGATQIVLGVKMSTLAGLAGIAFSLLGLYLTWDDDVVDIATGPLGQIEEVTSYVSLGYCAIATIGSL